MPESKLGRKGDSLCSLSLYSTPGRAGVRFPLRMEFLSSSDHRNKPSPAIVS